MPLTHLCGEQQRIFRGLVVISRASSDYLEIVLLIKTQRRAIRSAYFENCFHRAKLFAPRERFSQQHCPNPAPALFRRNGEIENLDLVYDSSRDKKTRNNRFFFAHPSSHLPARDAIVIRRGPLRDFRTRCLNRENRLNVPLLNPAALQF